MVADQRMPHLTGVELATLARKLAPNLVTIILSAYSDPKAIIAAINEGQVFRFIRKPWDNNDLVHSLHQAIDRHRVGVANARLVGDLERRLKALEILQSVMGLMISGGAKHPMGELLGRLQEVVPYDLAALLLLDADGEASLELISDGAVSEENATSLRDQAVELFGFFADRGLDQERLRIHARLRVEPGAGERRIESQTELPLKLGDEVVGVLLLQSFDHAAFPEDVSRLLDQLANGTAAALVQVREAASRRWSHMEQALAAIPDGVVLTDSVGKIQVANASARRLLADGAPLHGAVWRYLGVSSGEVVDRNETVELLVGASERPVEVRAVTAESRAGGARGVLVVLRDVGGLEAAEIGRHEFISTFSHEIRTPLSSISAAIDLLLDGFVGDLSEQQRGYLSMAGKARDGLNRMVDQLLDLERYARGVVEHEPQPMALDTMARATIDQFEAAAHERDLSIVLQAPEALPPLEADPRRLEQVLVNLLNNAIKYTDRKTTVAVELMTSDLSGPWHVISLHSRGPGIASADLDVIFDRFARGHGGAMGRGKRRRPKGSGLGLAICRNIIDGHGGAILAESDEGSSTFWVALPSVWQGHGPVEHVEGGPLWITGERRADVVAAAAIFARQGLWVRLAPTDADGFGEARASIGDGVCVSLDGPVDVPGPGWWSKRARRCSDWPWRCVCWRDIGARSSSSAGPRWLR